MANLRKDNPNRAAARARWLATAPAVIQKPLRFVLTQDSKLVTLPNGKAMREFGPFARQAVMRANLGDGAHVKYFARDLLQLNRGGAA